MRFSVGAVNVRSGNFVYFDTETHTIGPEHIMASAALPPAFAAVEIEGERSAQNFVNGFLSKLLADFERAVRIMSMRARNVAGT